MSDYVARWSTATELAAQRHAEWLALVETSLEPNPFYGPAFLCASEAHLTRSGALDCLVITLNGQLCGVFPLHRPVLHEGQAGLFREGYRNPYLCLGTPLLDAAHAEGVLACALQTLEQSRWPGLLRFSQIGSAFRDALQGTVRAHQFAALPSYERAALKIRTTPLPALSRGMRRKAAALGATGRIETRLIASGTDAFATGLTDLLALEAKGWKGRGGTALYSRANTSAFSRSAFAQFGRIEMLLRDGAMIAGLIDLVAAGRVFSVKTAYDEALSPYSPGRLLDALSPQLYAGEDAVTMLDSCAMPGHVLEAQWPDRIALHDVVIGLGAPGLSAASGARWITMMRSLRARLKPAG